MKDYLVTKTPFDFHGVNMALSEVIILQEEAAGNCLVPFFWGAGSIPSIFEQGWELPGHGTVMH